MPEELEEAVERLRAQKLATCPCPEHMKRKSVAIINIPFIMRKVEPDIEDEEEIDSEEKEEAQNEEVNPQNLQEETNREKDSGFSSNGTIPARMQMTRNLMFMRMQISHVHFVGKCIFLLQRLWFPNLLDSLLD